MTNLAGRLRGVLLILVVGAVVACTPGSGGSTAAPPAANPSVAPVVASPSAPATNPSPSGAGKGSY